MYDAVGIEYSFAYLFKEELGKRGTKFDADVFRNGSAGSLSKLIAETADVLKGRVEQIEFEDIESENGGAKARLEVAIKRLGDVSASMKDIEDEPNDYHWTIIGTLASTIAALLDHFEGDGAPRSRR